MQLSSLILISDFLMWISASILICGLNLATDCDLVLMGSVRIGIGGIVGERGKVDGG